MVELEKRITRGRAKGRGDKGESIREEIDGNEESKAENNRAKREEPG